MPYPAITSRRVPYDIDGTAVGKSTSGLLTGISSWLNSAALGILNNQNVNYSLGTSDKLVLWFFFPEKIEIEAMMIQRTGDYLSAPTIQGSNDTANGLDGTWENAVFTPSAITTDSNAWRTTIFPVSFSAPMKCLRININNTHNYNERFIKGIHIYGRKAAGETPNDILLCDSNGNELTAIMDWGDRPEGTTVIKSLRIKNASTTKIANNVNLQLNHTDFLMSLDQVNWVATIDIASIPANSLSAEIFVKNSLGAPPLTLGPKAARIIATVGSFT